MRLKLLNIEDKDRRTIKNAMYFNGLIEYALADKMEDAYFKVFIEY